MARKGEPMSPELIAKMREGRRLSRLQAKEAQARSETRHEPVVPDVNDLDVEDVSLPMSQPAMVEEEPTPEPPAGDPTDPYQQWLMVLDADTRELFGEKELRDLYAENQAKAAAEKKTRRRKEISDLALSTARSNLGLLPMQKVEQMRVTQQNAKRVSMIVSLPPAQDNGAPADVGVRVDGNVIANGTRHFCTYGEAASLREILYRAQQHELMFKGHNLRYRAYLLGQAMGSVNTQIDLNQRDGIWR